MGVVKVARSGKSVMFIDDDGRVYMAPVSIIQRMLDGTYGKKLFLLSLLPFRANPDQFMQSPIWDPDGIMGLVPDEERVDGLQNKSQRLKEERDMFSDKVVW